MKKKILLTFTVIFFAFCAFGFASCDDGSKGLSYELTSSGYSVTGMGTCTDTDIVIPSTHRGKPVTSIGAGAFYWCNGLTSVVIPDSVTSIGESAFYECRGLTSIVIPDSVTSIGYEAFGNCTLKDVTIGNNVASIGRNAFGLSSVYYDNDDHWVDNVLYLTATDGKTLYLITAKNSIAEEYEIAEGTKVIAGGAFYGCSGLKSVVIPDGVVNIGYEAFAYCSELTNIVIPDSVTEIEGEAFYECSGLKSVIIPDSVTEIGYGAFRDCTSLTSVTIGNGVTSISSSEFEGCSGLTSIIIPDSVTNIYYDAFNNTSFYNNSENWKDNVLYLTATDGKTLYLIKADSSISGDYEIAEGTKVIAVNAFEYCSGLTSIVIPDSVTSIGQYAFEYCKKLTSVTIGSGVTSIGQIAFAYCTSLTSVTFKNTSGWWCSHISTATSGTSISNEDLADPATAAEYLTGTYCNYYWTRN